MQLGNDVEAARLGHALDGGADLAQRGAGPDGADARLQGGAGRGLQALGGGVGRADGDRGRGVGVVAVELERDVERDELALAQHAVAGDAVDDLVVHAQAYRAGIAGR